MITIGKMSLACHCSPKTLRHYDQIGLLKPIKVDLETGFRYYAPEQIDTMLKIQHYKQLGFSLTDIAALLDASKKKRLEWLQAQRQQLLLQMDSLRYALHQIDVDIKNLEEPNMNSEKDVKQDYKIDCSFLPKQFIYGLRERLSVKDFGWGYSQLMEKMKDFSSVGLFGARYFCEDFDPNSDSDVELFALLPDKNHANGYVGDCWCVHTVHLGGYSNLSLAYAAIIQWMEQNDYEMAGAPFEIYAQLGAVPIQDWRTDIYFPTYSKNNPLKKDSYKK